MIDKFAIAEMEREKEIIAELVPRLGKHKIEELRRVIDKHYIKRFKGKSKIPKYGSLNKGFTEDQLQAFMLSVDNPKFKLLFQYQACLGLRIGEACRIKKQDINWQTRELLLHTEKSGTCDTLLIPNRLFEDTRAWIEENNAMIDKCEGYVFFVHSEQSPSKNIYVDTDYARNKFRFYLAMSRLDEVYATTEETSKERTPRNLHRLTTHSLRHYAITRFAKHCNGNLILTSRFARHHEPNTTMTYIAKDKEQLYLEIDNMFR